MSTLDDSHLEEKVREFAEVQLGGPEACPELISRLSTSLSAILHSDRRREYARRDPSEENLNRVVHAEFVSDRFHATCGDILEQLGEVPDQERTILEFAVALHPRELGLPTDDEKPDDRKRKLKPIADRLGTFLRYRNSDRDEIVHRVVGVTQSSANIADEFMKSVPLTYLWTVPDGLLVSMVKCFVLDGESAKYILTHWPAAPQEGDPDPWHSPGLYERVRLLRGRIASKLFRCGVKGDSLAHAVADAWQFVHTRLRSPTSSYHFESPFEYWFLMQVRGFDPEIYKSSGRHETASRASTSAEHMNQHADPEGPNDELRRGPTVASEATSRFQEVVDGGPEPGEAALAKEKMRNVREAYRCVRTTFFAKVDPNMTDAKAVEVNESTRRIIDALYKRWLSKGEKGERPTAVKEIADEYGLSESTVNNWFSDLRRRTKVFLFARYPQRQLTNQEIIDKAEPRARGHEIASLAKTVSGDRCFAWTFAAYVALRSSVEPGIRDPWDYQRIAHEIKTCWLYDDLQHNVLAREFAPDGAFSARLRRCLSDIFDLLPNSRDQSDCPPTEGALSAAEMLERIAAYRPDERFVADCEPSVEQCLRDLLGRQEEVTPAAACKEAPVKGDKERSWIIPLFYLACVDRIRDEDIFRGVVPSPNEERTLNALTAYFRRLFPKPAAEGSARRDT